MTQFSLNDIRPVDETGLSEKELSIKKEKDEIAKLLDRQENGFIIEKKDILEDERYKRQIAFFDDLSPTKDGLFTQEILFKSSVVIFGVGSVGSNIAILLARAGVKKFTFIDFKKIKQNSKVRHLYIYDYNINMYKSDALKDYIKLIDKSIMSTL